MDGKLGEVGDRHTRTATFDLLLAKRMFFLKTHLGGVDAAGGHLTQHWGAAERM